MDSTAASYQYQADSHRLLQVTEQVIPNEAEGSQSIRTLAYDQNGNTVTDSDAKRMLDLTFNARNRLSTVIKDGEQVATYTYNALGQRVAKMAVTVGRLIASFDQTTPTQIFSPAFKQASGLEWFFSK